MRIVGRNINKKEDDAYPLNMRRNETQAPAPCGSLDDTGISHPNTGTVVSLDYSEVRNEGGERIIGDFWLRIVQSGEQRRLARIRQPYSPTSA
jgi:hypothetical protein